MDQFYDVAVIGAGPSGIAAAAYASKFGAKTVLLEKDSVIGGTAFKAFVSTLKGRSISSMDGLLNGITKKAWGNTIFSPEKLLDRYYALLENQSTAILDGYEVISVNSEGSNINSVVCSSPAGKTVMSAKIIIDASGSLAVETMTGQIDSGPPSYIYMTGLVGKVEAVGGKCYSEEAKILLEDSIRSLKEKGSLDKSLNIEVHPTVRADIAHITVRYDYSDSVAGSVMHRQMNKAVAFLQGFGYGFENVSLISSSKEIFSSAQGSFNAKYTLTLSDITNNKYFNDQVTALPDDDGDDDRVYFIPYGSFMSKRFSNLLLCGRNIGAEANAVMQIDSIPTHFETGKAAGIAASIAVRNDMTLDEVSAYEIKSKTENTVSDKIDALNEVWGNEAQPEAGDTNYILPETLDSEDVVQSISPTIKASKKNSAENFEELDRALGFLGDDMFKSPVSSEGAGIESFAADTEKMPSEDEPIHENSQPLNAKKNEVESLFDELGVLSEMTKEHKPESTPTQSEELSDTQTDVYTLPQINENFSPGPIIDDIIQDIKEESSDIEANKSESLLYDLLEKQDYIPQPSGETFSKQSAGSVEYDAAELDNDAPDKALIFEAEDTPIDKSSEEADIIKTDDVMSLLYDTGESVSSEKVEPESPLMESIVQDELSVLYEEEKKEKKINPPSPKKDMVSSMLEMIYDITEFEKNGGIPPINPNIEESQLRSEPEKTPENEIESKISNYDKFKAIKDFLYENDEE